MGICGSAVSYSISTSDNCPNESWVLNNGLATGATFPIGTTVNDFTVTDASNNTATCSFTVTVLDAEAPIAICQNINVDLDAQGLASISITDIENGSSDNCGMVNLSITAGQTAYTCTDAGQTFSVTVTADDGNSNTATCTAAVTVSDPNSACYCASFGQSTQYEWIDQVKFANIDNLSGNDNGYANFTNEVAFVTGGDSYSIELTPGYANGSTWEKWSVWIDFNQDGDFDDWGEILFSKSRIGTLNRTIHIPSSALTGTTRMRVSMKYGWSQSPCEIFTRGEVEDYTIDIRTCDNVTDGGQISGDELLCDGANDPALISSTAAASGGSGTIEYVWLENTTTSTPPTASNMNGWVEIPNSDAPTYDPGVITTTTWYLRCARRNGCTVYAGESNVIKKTLQTSCSGPDYCTSSGQSTQDEWIEEVKFGSIDNNSGNNNGYADFTNMSTNVTPGQWQLITLKSGLSSGFRYQHWRVWIDWNQDGDFADWGEREVQVIAHGATNRYISVPHNALSGTTRMRVSMRHGGFPDYCQDFSRGEVEDYTINVVSNNGNRQQSDQLQLVAVQELDVVDLTWVNNTGFKNDMFVVEKSMNGVNFEAIDEQFSLTGDQSEVYKTKDESPEAGANFYRIKLELNDSTTMYSNMQEVEITLDTDDVTVFPNPAEYQAYVSMKELAGRKGEVGIFNQYGKVLYQKDFESIPETSLRIDLTDFTSGIYFVKVSAEGRRVVTKRLVVVNEN